MEFRETRLGGGHGQRVPEGGSYCISPAALKRHTKCAACWPLAPKQAGGAGSRGSSSPAASFTSAKEMNSINELTDEAHFIGYMECLNYKEHSAILADPTAEVPRCQTTELMHELC